jgi:hypothetical protein
MKHPDRTPSFTVSRRQFWRALLQEAFVIHDAVQGKPGYALSDLGELPDHQVAQIRPVVHPDCEILVDQGHVWSRLKEVETPVRLFSTEQENLTAFNMFDGRHSLGEIGERLSREMGWDPDRGFAHARDLFLSLVGLLVCMPGNPPQTEG